MSSASEVFETIILELRPRLQSVNAFVSLSKEPESVKVVLGKESIRVITDKGLDEIPCGDINAVQCSLSGMKICDKFLTFRFATNNPQEIGGFKTELLQNTVASIESLSNKPLLSNNTAYTIQCLNCGKSLADSVKFDRVLPLPSENSDASDWFCHGQSNQMNGFSLDPKKTDCFYSQCFVHIHLERVVNVKCSGKLAVCRFCLQWLGIQQNPTTIRLWFNTVKFVGNNSCISTSSLQDAFKTVRNSFKYSVHNSVRLILTCQTSSSQVDAVLIWILEKNLQVLFNGSGSLKKHKVAKVLFKFTKSDEPTLKMWQNDAMVSSFSVSKIMMVDLLKHLHKFNKMFPSEYSKSNDFKISYLMLYDVTVNK